MIVVIAGCEGGADEHSRMEHDARVIKRPMAQSLYQSAEIFTSFARTVSHLWEAAQDSMAWPEMTDAEVD